jgi:hypothetical protein
MNKKLQHEDLRDNEKYSLLIEVSHHDLRNFIAEQLQKEKTISRVYMVYQIAMLLLFGSLFGIAVVKFIKDEHSPIIQIGCAFLFSMSILIIFHELLHALAYWMVGAKKISFGAHFKQFIFYALADKQVISSKAFHFIALTPFVAINILCLCSLPFIIQIYFSLSVMCIHSLFCAGDIAMISFYYLNRDKEIFNYDSKDEEKTYFYVAVKN